MGDFVYIVRMGYLKNSFLDDKSEGMTLEYTIHSTKDKAKEKVRKVLRASKNFVPHPHSLYWDDGRFFITIESRLVE